MAAGVSHARSWAWRRGAAVTMDVAAAAVTAALVDAAFAAAQRNEIGDWCRRELALYEAAAWTRYLMYPDLFPRPEAPRPSREAQKLLALTPVVQHQWAPVGRADWDGRHGQLRVTPTYGAQLAGSAVLP